MNRREHKCGSRAFESLGTGSASNVVTQQSERLSWNWPRPRGLDSGTALPEGFSVDRAFMPDSQEPPKDLFLTDHLPSRLVPCGALFWALGKSRFLDSAQSFASE